MTRETIGIGFDAMAIEIERKYLVKGSFPKDPAAREFLQAYIAREDGRTVRVRFDGVKYTLTIKGPSQGIRRSEFEFEIDKTAGHALLHEVCPARIEKVRHTVRQGSLTWEIDVFAGANNGLIVAEIELPSEETQFDLPQWVGPEVSDDPRFFNAKLMSAPFCDWGTSYKNLLAQASAA